MKKNDFVGFRNPSNSVAQWQPCGKGYQSEATKKNTINSMMGQEYQNY